MVKKFYNVFFSEISHEKRLIRDLLHDYDIISTLGRPVRNASDSVSISFALGLIRMDVEEKSNMLVLSAWTKYVSYLGVVVLLIFYLFGFYVAFNTVQVMSQQVVGRTEETSTYSWSRFCTVNCQTMASNYQLSHLRPCREPNPGLRGGRQEFYHVVLLKFPPSL